MDWVPFLLGLALHLTVSDSCSLARDLLHPSWHVRGRPLDFLLVLTGVFFLGAVSRILIYSLRLGKEQLAPSNR
ncbi:hypothetical protein COCOBI_19-2210 [Coccomyxa sp. Obi]|nr:hypothetical protein COCOBI_19-2210 [Coccomyxa sp. Obi]